RPGGGGGRGGSRGGGGCRPGLGRLIARRQEDEHKHTWQVNRAPRDYLLLYYNIRSFIRRTAAPPSCAGSSVLLYMHSRVVGFTGKPWRGLGALAELLSQPPLTLILNTLTAGLGLK